MILPLLLLALKAFVGTSIATSVGVAVAVVVMISYNDVLKRLQRHKQSDKDIGVLIGTMLANGEWTGVGQVWSRKSMGMFARELLHEEVFEGKLDPHLERILAQGDRVEIKI